MIPLSILALAAVLWIVGQEIARHLERMARPAVDWYPWRGLHSVDCRACGEAFITFKLIQSITCSGCLQLSAVERERKQLTRRVG